MFEGLISDIVHRTDLDERQADHLARAIAARLMHNSQGGFAALLTSIRERDAGLVEAWLGDDPKAGTIAPSEVDELLGSGWSSATADAIGGPVDSVRTGTVVALPGLVDAMTPGGVIPATDELERSYAGWAGGRVVRPLDSDEPPVGGFPGSPGESHRIEMALQDPPEWVRVKAYDGVATLLPWLLLAIGIPVLMIITGTAAVRKGAEMRESMEHTTVTRPMNEQKGPLDNTAPVMGGDSAVPAPPSPSGTVDGPRSDALPADAAPPDAPPVDGR